MSKVVVYDSAQQSKVKAYDELPKADKCGTFWENKDDKDLTKLKKHIKDFYIDSQKFTCVYCRQRIVVKHNANWDIEHIIPKKTHPQFLFKPENLCVACKDCNGKKSHKNVLVNNNKQSFSSDTGDYLIVHPHFDIYEDHIRIIGDSLMFLPKGDKGLYTIETCGLLRFIYNFSNYGNVTLEIKQRVGAMHQELMNTTNAMEEYCLMSMIEDMVKEGKRLAMSASPTY